MRYINRGFGWFFFSIPKVRFEAGMFLFLCLLAAGGGASVAAQNIGRVFLIEEIRNIENTLKTPKLSVAERYEVLIRQARLFQLIGNLEGAARSWMDAAAADQEKQDPRALLEGAFCFFAIGEMDKAEAAVKTVIRTGKDQHLICRAVYLSAQIEAFRSGDLSSLIELISDSEYEQYRPAIYYTLWKFSGTDRYKTRLLTEYPLSPEAFIVKEAASDKAVVHISPSAMWLLFPGRDNAVLEASAEHPAPSSVTGERRPIALQTGLFSREENAKAMAERLKTAGFEAVITRRTANDEGIYWVVTVPAGIDIHRTTAQLKDKGFDSFPVF
ncbi:MAG: SPOR domain-containing protein [Treponema sp.]|jgi:hypothetical protein|nr:SPOR domain-containing protein [Treponema sp.]